jgi:hypothetical protein
VTTTLQEREGRARELGRAGGRNPGKCLGYFANEHGEQAIYTYDFDTGEATLTMGDTGWQVTHPVVNGKAGGGLLLTEAELAWLRACWMATGELSRQLQSGEDADPRA